MLVKRDGIGLPYEGMKVSMVADTMGRRKNGHNEGSK